MAISGLLIRLSSSFRLRLLAAEGQGWQEAGELACEGQCMAQPPAQSTPPSLLAAQQAWAGRRAGRCSGPP